MTASAPGLAQRSFFIDRKVDAAIARLATANRTTSSEQMSLLLARGHALAGDDMLAGKLPEGMAAAEDDDPGERSHVWRSILIPPAIDEELRFAAFKHRASRGALLRWLLDEALRAAA